MSENPAGLNQAAMQALGAGDFATAQALLQRLVTADPSSIPGWLNLAAVRRRLNDVNGAFDALRDAHLPRVDGLLIGGGFPEVQAAALAANTSLRTEIRARIEAGMPVYAECGGLMYLARSIEWQGRRHAMAGALPADVVMESRPVGRGYVELDETADFRAERTHGFGQAEIEEVGVLE